MRQPETTIETLLTYLQTTPHSWDTLTTNLASKSSANQPTTPTFSPSTFLQSGQYNTCWLTKQDKAPVFVVYDQQHPLGNGSFATVYKAISPEFPRLLALRISTYPPGVNPFSFEGVFAAKRNGSSYITLLPKAEMDLNSYIMRLNREPKQFLLHHLPIGDETKIINISIGAARAVYNLHKQDIAHLDIKPENFLVTDTASSAPKITLADFDLAEKGIKRTDPIKKCSPVWYCMASKSNDTGIITLKDRDQFALRRTLFLPNGNIEIMYRGRNDNGWVMHTFSRENLLRHFAPITSIMSDDFFSNRPHLKNVLSASSYKDVGNFSVGEILCALLLTKYNLFEIFADQRFEDRMLPSEFTSLLLAYQEENPECELLGHESIQNAIKTLADCNATTDAKKEAITHLKTAMTKQNQSVSAVATPPAEGARSTRSSWTGVGLFAPHHNSKESAPPPSSELPNTNVGAITP